MRRKPSDDVWEWLGVEVEGGGLTSLSWNYHGLLGALSADIGALSALKELYLYGNKLSGCIPPTVGALTNLIGLHLRGNPLSGVVTSTLSNLANLESLDLTEYGLANTPCKDLRERQEVEQYFAKLSPASSTVSNEPFTQTINELEQKNAAFAREITAKDELLAGLNKEELNLERLRRINVNQDLEVKIGMAASVKDSLSSEILALKSVEVISVDTGLTSPPHQKAQALQPLNLLPQGAEIARLHPHCRHAQD